MKNVNKDKILINLIKCGSSFIYSNEYKCTEKDTKKIINSIEADNASNINPHLIEKRSKVNHKPKLI